MREIPSWIVSLVGAVYRFMVGGFGVTLPHPWRTNFCGPFWVVFLGIIPGLPLVLSVVTLGWVIRLIFGQGRARRLFSNEPMRKIANILPILAGVILVGVVVTLLILLVIDLIREFGLVKVLVGAGCLAVCFACVLLIVKIVARIKRTDWYQEREKKRCREKQERRRESFVVERRLLRPLWILLWIPVMLAQGIGAIAYTIGLMVYAVYKRFCPLVEFP